ncbi:tol-pal system protein YbgF [Marinobacter confluentis]|uniref:Cell division coordinator CpoB n=1 Tax=Marinobacter confluentis TaxID=1697557 RepID=A0A4Z1C2H1_9GAMM|nr:tol-pal system protein YbgF [Marinobacter confluentis]TGN41478.1 tol-pal system protein YbgF [Marinobacter confluentis]
MRQTLMATLLLPLAIWPAGAVFAQSSGSGQGSQANAELFYMIQQLQGEVRRLQGDVEEQRNQIDKLNKQARDRYIDLDQRILKLSSELAESDDSGSGTSGPADSGNNTKPVERRDYRQPTSEEREAYDRIQALIREDRNFNDAINGLYDFIDKYEEGDLTVNAYYWLGEVYLAEEQLEQAKQAFTIVATRYGDHRKAPDAVYKLGVTLDKQGETDEAKRRMEAVIRNYPDSNAASLSKKYLDGKSG